MLYCILVLRHVTVLTKHWFCNKCVTSFATSDSQRSSSHERTSRQVFFTALSTDTIFPSFWHSKWFSNFLVHWGDYRQQPFSSNFFFLLERKRQLIFGSDVFIAGKIRLSTPTVSKTLYMLRRNGSTLCGHRIARYTLSPTERATLGSPSSYKRNR